MNTERRRRPRILSILPHPVPRLSALLGLLSIGLVPAMASGGRVPIHQVPTTISAPGSYYLSRDLAGAGGTALIEIAADDVTIDLAGHTLRRTDTIGDGIRTAASVTGIEIFGGRIVGGRRGLSLTRGDGSSFEVRVHDLYVRDAADVGVWVEAGPDLAVPAHVVIDRIEVSDTGSHGISLRFLHGARVEDCVVRAAGGNGIDVQGGSGVMLAGNSVLRSAVYGIALFNTVGSTLRKNEVLRSGDDGIFGLDIEEFMIVENQMGNNGGDGLDLKADHGMVRLNNSLLNTGFGLRFVPRKCLPSQNILVDSNWIIWNQAGDIDHAAMCVWYNPFT
ncbi:MAG: right-handed parallel beta-helix repeat-containing protein [Acidobacteria bacterium]|nr:MAG: right-handed parallel beta-helix repeat-containing protein [Acidobacteriota bacterium]